MDWNSKKEVLEILCLDYKNLQYASVELRNDKEVCMRAIE
jgi:hypothetical protein